MNRPPSPEGASFGVWRRFSSWDAHRRRSLCTVGVPLEYAIRATLTKELLAVVRTWDADRAEVIVQAVGKQGIAEIDARTALGWVDFGLHMRLSDAVRAEVGSEGNVQAWSATFQRVSQRPMLASFFAAMLRITRSPAILFKGVSRVFQLLNHNIGTTSFEMGEEPNNARIDLIGFPAEAYSIDCYAEGLLGSIRAVMRLALGSGVVTLDLVDPSSGHIRYTLAW